MAHKNILDFDLPRTRRDSGIITPSLALNSFLEYFGNPDAPIRGAIVSVYQAGAWLGSASVGITSDRIGRRKAIAFGCVFGVLGGALMTGAAHVAMLIIGRILVGYAVGTITGVAPVFGAEIAKSKNQRSYPDELSRPHPKSWLRVTDLGVGEGKWHNPNQWRLGFAVQSIPALALGVGVLFIKESPRWLCLKSRHAEAEKAFRSYHHNGSNDEWCREEFRHLQANIAIELQARGCLSWAELLKAPAFRKRLFVGSFVWAAAMLSGISFIQYFQPAIYATLQYNQDQQLLISGLYGSVAPVTCLVSLLFVDRIGRKKILVFSASLLSLCYLIITIIAAVFPARPGFPTNEAAQRGLIACVFVVSANYSALLGPMTWIIPYIKSCPIMIAENITYEPKLGEANDWASWLTAHQIFFVLTNALCAIVFALVYPETRGKSLEDMSEIFGDIKRRTEPELDEVHSSPSGKKDSEISEYAIEKTESKYHRDRRSDIFRV
uniref:Related to ascus development protein 3 n=1 Tax=Neurospora crassa TaxID=5141 RepID=Q9P679_NEUCS|nr:related to ascus development protein 3 [Neurospora crassa]